MIPSNLVALVVDFITDRKAYVEVNTTTSQMIKFRAGCPQGSTLGPRVFNIYCNDLLPQIESHAKLVTYADDSYIIVEASPDEDLQQKTKLIMERHIEWLNKNGMVCNVSKTEMMVFNSRPVNIELGDMTVSSRDEMKVLGVTFDSGLKWTAQVDGVIKKTNRMLFALRRSRRFMNKAQSVKAITAFYFSVLYYGAEIWYHRHLAFHLKQKIRAAHYRALRLVFGKNNTRDSLDVISGRGSPDEWSDYALAKLAARMIISEEPTRLCEDVLTNAYVERRRAGMMQFYDSSKRKIGRQVLKNRLPCVMKQMKFDWLWTKKETLRPKMKKCFFRYSKVEKVIPK